MMHAASREALKELRPIVDRAAGDFSTRDARVDFSAELYSVAGVLTEQPRLRRMLADPSALPDARSGLAGALLESKLSSSAVQVVKDAAALRWSSPWDLVDAIELAGDDVLLAAAEQDNVIDSIEDELFRFERILDNQSDLTALLDEQAVDPKRRSQLLDSVLGDKVNPITLALLHHAVASERKRSVLLAIDDLVELAAQRRERSVARVASPIELSGEQQQNLASALSRLYGRDIDVRYSVEPGIRGGLVVRVGDEIIDGSVAARLAHARGAFAE